MEQMRNAKSSVEDFLQRVKISKISCSSVYSIVYRDQKSFSHGENKISNLLREKRVRNLRVGSQQPHYYSEPKSLFQKTNATETT